MRGFNDHPSAGWVESHLSIPWQRSSPRFNDHPSSGWVEITEKAVCIDITLNKITSIEGGLKESAGLVTILNIELD